MSSWWPASRSSGGWIPECSAYLPLLDRNLDPGEVRAMVRSMEEIAARVRAG